MNPEQCEASIKSRFEWLIENGHKPRAVALLEELNLSIRLLAHMVGKKSAYRARKDGDWETLLNEMKANKTPNDLRAWSINQRERVSVLPYAWVGSFKEEFDRYMAILKGTDNGQH